MVQAATSPSAPAVTVLSPNGGESLSGDVTIEWSGSDADGDSLLYNLSYSADGGDTFEPLAMSVSGESLTLPPTAFAGSPSALIRIDVSDGVRAAFDTSDAPFAVAGHAPDVLIDRPRDGELYAGDELIVLEGGALDREDGPIPDARLRWRSDRDDLLGTGSSLMMTATDRTEGEHLLTLEATDSSSVVGMATVGLRVAARDPTRRRA